MTQNTQIPGERIPPLLGRDERFSREWYAFLRELFRRTGGGTSSTTITEVVSTVTSVEAQMDVSLAFLPGSTPATTTDADIIRIKVFGD